jgi:hypothetical protein
MLHPFKRWFGSRPEVAHPGNLQRWAEAGGHGFRKVRDAGGCVIDGHTGPQAWRIEWGESQRNYIQGCEIRLIAELNLPHALMAMVLNRVLMAEMEREVYEQYVNDVQTRVDTDTPPEMRWLVMHPKLENADLGLLKDRFGAVGSVPPWLLEWLSGPLRDALHASTGVVRPDHPFALTLGRGRLTLRTAMPQPDAARLAMWFSVFEHALRSARTVGEQWQAAAGGLTTQPGAWAHSEPPRSRLPTDL